jgi:phage-related baseplate assembly protein
VFVTVAGIDGAAVGDRSVLHTKLVSAMQKAGDSFVPIAVKTYQSMTFKVVAAVKVASDADEEIVLDAVESALEEKFSFDARAFGQPVTLSEVIAVMQDVSGVVAVDVDKLHRTDENETRSTFLRAFAPQVGADPDTPAAELLTIDPEAIELRVMP